VSAMAESSIDSLENLDALLLGASRTSAEKVDKAALQESIIGFRGNLDKLIKSVPANDLAQAQKIASSYLSPPSNGAAKEAKETSANGINPNVDDSTRVESKQPSLKRKMGDDVQLEDLL
jgi:hypothetical protein